MSDLSVDLLGKCLSILHHCQYPQLDIQIHIQALETVKQNCRDAQFILHIAAIFSQSNLRSRFPSITEVSTDIRQLSGFIIKNSIFPELVHVHDDVASRLLQALVSALVDPLPSIRRTSAIVLAKYADSFPFRSWSGMFVNIIETISCILKDGIVIPPSSAESYYLDGSIHAIRNICEDASEKLSMDIEIKPLDMLCPLLIKLLSVNDATVRQYSIQSYNALIYLLSDNNKNRGGVAINIPALLNSLSSLSLDSNQDVRLAVIQCLTTLASHHLPYLDTMFDSVCRFMVSLLSDSQESVAMESCQYWITLIDQVHNGYLELSILEEYAVMLLPSIISHLRLSEEQREWDRQSDEDAASGNIRELELNRHRDRDANQSRREFDAEQEELEKLSSHSTIRTSCASLLDSFASLLDPENLWVQAWPSIFPLLQSPDVWALESGILAIGILSSYYSSSMVSIIPSFFPSLLSASVSHEIPELRAICCWTISQFAGSWIFSDDVIASGACDQSILPSLHAMLLSASLDKSSRVQCAVWSCYSILFDYGREHWLPYVLSILECFPSRFQFYGIKAKILLIDGIATLAESTGSEGFDDRQRMGLYFPIILYVLFRTELPQTSPPLIAYPFLLPSSLSSLYPQLVEALSPSVCSLCFGSCLESMTYFLEAMQHQSQPFVSDIYQRSLQCLQVLLTPSEGLIFYLTHLFSNFIQCLHFIVLLDNNGNSEQDHCVCFIDILTTLLEVYRDSMLSLMESTNTKLLFIAILIQAIQQNDSPALQQSGLGLLGEVISAIPAILSCDPSIVASFQSRLLFFTSHYIEDHPMINSNAYWTLGEYLKAMNDEGRRAIIGSLPHTMECILSILESSCNVPDSELEQAQLILLQNVLVCLSRISIAIPEYFFPMGGEFYLPFCRGLRHWKEHSSEREEACMGLIFWLCQNVGILSEVENSLEFCRVCSIFEDPIECQELRVKMSQILVYIKENHKAVWQVLHSRISRKTWSGISDIFQTNCL